MHPSIVMAVDLKIHCWNYLLLGLNDMNLGAKGART